VRRRDEGLKEPIGRSASELKASRTILPVKKEGRLSQTVGLSGRGLRPAPG
jgi:hypothetical protein